MANDILYGDNYFFNIERLHVLWQTHFEEERTCLKKKTLEANEMKVPSKIDGNTNIDRIRSQ